MIWIVGSKGMLGTEITSLLEKLQIPFVGTDREVSILDMEALRSFVKDRHISWIVNCAAYTAVDKAEDEADLCFSLNALGPENLARLAAETSSRLIHISTDYVFSGTPILQDGQPRPYLEDDPTGPTGIYGKTKKEGEERILLAAPESVIIRTAWLYGQHGNNFVYTMLRLMKEKESLGVVADQRGTPTWAYDLAQAILFFVGTSNSRDIFWPAAGIYHYTNEGETTWYDFAREIYRLGRRYGLLQRDCSINPISTEQYPTKARRPAYSVLSKEKIKSLGVSVPEWQDSLEKFISKIAQQS